MKLNKTKHECRYFERKGPFLVGREQLSRPYLRILYDESRQLVLGMNTSELPYDCSRARDWILHTLERPASSIHPFLPAVLRLDDDKLMSAVQFQFRGMGIKCVLDPDQGQLYKDLMSGFFESLPEDSKTMLPSLVELVGLETTKRFFELSYRFLELKVWSCCPDGPLQATRESDGCRCIVTIMGSGGEEFGLSLVSTVEDLNAMNAGRLPQNWVFQGFGNGRALDPLDYDCLEEVAPALDWTNVPIFRACPGMDAEQQAHWLEIVVELLQELVSFCTPVDVGFSEREKISKWRLSLIQQAEFGPRDLLAAWGKKSRTAEDLAYFMACYLESYGPKDSEKCQALGKLMLTKKKQFRVPAVFYSDIETFLQGSHKGFKRLWTALARFAEEENDLLDDDESGTEMVGPEHLDVAGHFFLWVVGHHNQGLGKPDREAKWPAAREAVQRHFESLRPEARGAELAVMTMLLEKVDQAIDSIPGPADGKATSARQMELTRQAVIRDLLEWSEGD